MVFTAIERTFRHAAAAHAAGRLRRAVDERSRSKARQLLASRLGRLHGIPQKIGQMLSFAGGDAVAAFEFGALQDQAEPCPLDALLPQLERAWGCAVRKVVETIESRGHAASIGQVYRARLRDGRWVAIKVQYPGIRAALQTDIRCIGLAGKAAGFGGRGFNLDGYRQALSTQLQAELDYRREALHQTELRAWADGTRIVIPEVVPELSTDTVLVSQWVDGVAWTEARDKWPAEERQVLSRSLLDFFVQGILRHGAMQSDWHPGNVRCRRGADGPEWVLYDFGGLCRLSAEQRCVLARLLRATSERSESPWPLLLSLGFDAEKLAPLAHKLPALCQVLLEPLTAEYPYELAVWRLRERLADVLGDDRWNFRAAGPAELLPLVRAFHGVMHYLAGLGAPVRAERTVQSCLAVLRPQLDALTLPAGQADAPGFAGVARWLKVRIRRDGQTVVQLTQSARSVEHLPELLDEEVRRRIALQGIDLERIATDVRKRGYAPGPVFSLADTEREFAVWLE